MINKSVIHPIKDVHLFIPFIPILKLPKTNKEQQVVKVLMVSFP